MAGAAPSAARSKPRTVAGAAATQTATAPPVPRKTAKRPKPRPAIDDVDFIDDEDDPFGDDFDGDDDFDDDFGPPARRTGAAPTRRKAAAKKPAKKRKKSSSSEIAFGGIWGGIGVMILAVVWFVGGIIWLERIFIYPPILFIVGFVGLIKGLIGSE